MAVNFDTLSGRLRWAIDRQPHQGRRSGQRLLAKQLEDHAPKLLGRTLSSIRTYLEGKQEPSLAFLREAAEVLGVRLPWLTYGIGQPTEEEQRAVETAADPKFKEAIQIIVDQLRDGLLETFPQFWSLPDVSRALVWRSVDRIHWHLAEKLQDVRRQEGEFFWATVPTVDIGRTVGSYLASPFNMLHIDPDDLDSVSLALIVEGLITPIDILYLKEESATDA